MTLERIGSLAYHGESRPMAQLVRPATPPLYAPRLAGSHESTRSPRTAVYVYIACLMRDAVAIAAQPRPHAAEPLGVTVSCGGSQNSVAGSSSRGV